METAFHTSSCSRFSVGQALELAARSGYRQVEIAADISESRHFEAHRAGMREVAGFTGMLRSLGLRLAAIDIGGWDAPLCIANLDERQRAAAVENVRRAMGAAGDLGCPLVNSHLWGLPTEGTRERAEDFRAAFLRSAAELAPALEQHGVRLNFMPHPGGFVEESDAAVDLVREAGSPQIGYTTAAPTRSSSTGGGRRLPAWSATPGTPSPTSWSPTRTTWSGSSPRRK